MTEQQLINYLQYQQPDAEQIEKIQALRKMALDFGRLILGTTPKCGDQLVAIQRLRESLQMAVAAIVCCENNLDEMRDAMSLPNSEGHAILGAWLKKARDEKLFRKLDEFPLEDGTPNKPGFTIDKDKFLNSN